MDCWPLQTCFCFVDLNMTYVSSNSSHIQRVLFKKQLAAYIMADAGYDVWLSNMRGNIYSNKHQTFDSEKDPEYWKFS